MLTMLTTEEFAAWFRELPDAAAEEVATGLDLIELLGPEANPPASSEYLLYYESLSGHPRIDGFYRRAFVPILERMRHIMQHLESNEVREALSRAPFERARRASEALQRLQGRLRPLYVMRTAQSVADELERSYRTVLEALELEEAPPSPPGSALRELSLRKHEPGLRILYGVDVPNRRALAVWGDHMNRNAYGASVRKALALWQEFRDGATLPQLQTLRSDR